MATAETHLLAPPEGAVCSDNSEMMSVAPWSEWNSSCLTSPSRPRLTPVSQRVSGTWGSGVISLKRSDFNGPVQPTDATRLFERCAYCTT